MRLEEVRGLSTTKKKCKAIIYLSILLHIFEICEMLFHLHLFFLKGFADKRPRKELRKDKTTTLPEYSDSESAHEFKSDQERRIETVEEVRRLSTKNKKCKASVNSSIYI